MHSGEPQPAGSSRPRIPLGGNAFHAHSVTGWLHIQYTRTEWRGTGSRPAQRCLHQVCRRFLGQDRFPQLGRCSGVLYSSSAVGISLVLAEISAGGAVGTRLVRLVHPAAVVDELAGLQNRARSAMRQPDTKPPAGGVIRTDADPGRSRFSLGRLHSIDPCHPMAVAANDDPIELHGKRRRTTSDFGPEFASGPSGHRRRVHSEVRVVTESIELDALLRDGKEPSDTGLRVGIRHRGGIENSAPEEAGQHAQFRPEVNHGRHGGGAEPAIPSGAVRAAIRREIARAAPRARDGIRAVRLTAVPRSART